MWSERSFKDIFIPFSSQSLNSDFSRLNVTDLFRVPGINLLNAIHKR